jgi:LemA protein
MSVTVIIVLIVVLVLLFGIGFYNRFVKLRTRVKEAWSDIDVQLKRRYDLIPNLIETVKGYAAHEQSTFDKVTKARADAISAEGAHDKAQAENMLTGALKSVFAVAEAYPDLKANENFLELQRELTDTENKIQAARRFYNTNVRDMNISVQTFPSNIVAGVFHFIKEEFFELDEAEAGAAKEPVKVNF